MPDEHPAIMNSRKHIGDSHSLIERAQSAMRMSVELASRVTVKEPAPEQRAAADPQAETATTVGSPGEWDQAAQIARSS